MLAYAVPVYAYMLLSAAALGCSGLTFPFFRSFILIRRLYIPHFVITVCGSHISSRIYLLSLMYQSRRAAGEVFKFGAIVYYIQKQIYLVGLEAILLYLVML